MAATPAPIAMLLAELARRGIQLEAQGARLRYRPRSAMTPELAERVRAHKPGLLAVLQEACGPNDAPVSVSRVSGAEAQDPPHELSLAERVEAGYVNPGWSPAAWAERLQQLADRCEALHPELAAQYRAWAANVPKNEKGLA
jgi:hypothetical protein